MIERIIKHWITSIIGLIIMAASVYLFFHGRLSAWELVPGALLGAFFFWAKDNMIRRVTSKYFSRNSNHNERIY
jgi:dolichyl-phosphate-mannose--protein O-mannosyl transferase